MIVRPPFHMKRPGVAGSLALVVAVGAVPVLLGAGCALMLVQPACLIACHAAVAADAPASAASGGAAR
jgi:hypothetical protein